MLEVLADLDRLLATSPAFLLGPWLAAARSVATNDQDAALYEFNARNQITLWGPDGQILDYAGKQWSGLVSDYYLPRWRLFFVSLERCVTQGTEFDQGQFQEEFITILGRPFTQARDIY